MTFALMQPYFFPYLGYFQLIESVEHFMFFDDVQYIRKSWMGRNRLLNIEKNEPYYFHPELIKPDYKALLPTVRLASNEQWKLKILEQLKGYKNKAAFYNETTSILEEILNTKYSFLVELNIKSTSLLCEYLEVKTKIDKYTDYDFWFEAKPDIGDWGREVAKAMKATDYINAPGGESFIFPEKFSEINLKLGFIQPNLANYDQHSDKFVPGLSIIDVLMFNGKEKTKEMLNDYSIKWKN